MLPDQQWGVCLWTWIHLLPQLLTFLKRATVPFLPTLVSQILAFKQLNLSLLTRGPGFPKWNHFLDTLASSWPHCLPSTVAFPFTMIFTLQHFPFFHLSPLYDLPSLFQKLGPTHKHTVAINIVQFLRYSTQPDSTYVSRSIFPPPSTGSFAQRPCLCAPSTCKVPARPALGPG